MGADVHPNPSSGAVSMAEERARATFRARELGAFLEGGEQNLKVSISVAEALGNGRG